MEIKEGVQLLRGLGDRCSGGQGQQRSGVQKNDKAGSEIITYMISEIAKMEAIGEYSELVLISLGKGTVAWASKLGDFRGEGRIVACKIMNF